MGFMLRPCERCRAGVAMAAGMAGASPDAHCPVMGAEALGCRSLGRLMNAVLLPSRGPPRGPCSHSVSLICIKYPFLAGFPPPLLPPSRLFCE